MLSRRAGGPDNSKRLTWRRDGWSPGRRRRTGCRRRILIENLEKGEFEPMYTQEDAALIFVVDVRTIYNWLEKGIARGGLQRIGTGANGESVLRKYKLLRKRKKLPDPQLLFRRPTA